MLQPVLPYAIVGLALGSLLKRPGTGALVGSVVGLARTTAEPSGISPPEAEGMGIIPAWVLALGAKKESAPTSTKATYSIPSYVQKTAKTTSEAKMIAGYVYKAADPVENEGWSPRDIAFKWPGAPWNKPGADEPLAILLTARVAIRGKPGHRKASKFLEESIKWTKTWEKRISTPEAKERAKKQDRLTTQALRDLFKSRTKREATEKTSRSYRSPVQGRRDDTKAYISASPSPFGEDKWYKTTGGKVGIAALAGVSALVLVLMLTGKKK